MRVLAQNELKDPKLFKVRHIPQIFKGLIFSSEKMQQN